MMIMELLSSYKKCEFWKKQNTKLYPLCLILCGEHKFLDLFVHKKNMLLKIISRHSEASVFNHFTVQILMSPNHS